MIQILTLFSHETEEMYLRVQKHSSDFFDLGVALLECLQVVAPFAFSFFFSTSVIMTLVATILSASPISPRIWKKPEFQMLLLLFWRDFIQKYICLIAETSNICIDLLQLWRLNINRNINNIKIKFTVILCIMDERKPNDQLGRCEKNYASQRSIHQGPFKF